MDIIEALYQEAYQQGIDIQHEEIPVQDMDAAYIQTAKGSIIVLRRSGTRAEQTCWLAEELGHHHTGDHRVLRYDTVADWKAEVRARRWAHDRLLSCDAIMTAARSTDDIYEIAAMLDVSMAFLCEAINDYKARGIWAG